MQAALCFDGAKAQYQQIEYVALQLAQCVGMVAGQQSCGEASGAWVATACHGIDQRGGPGMG